MRIRVNFLPAALLLVATLNSPTTRSNENVGYSVAVSGTRAVAATPIGKAYVYDLASDAPTIPAVTLALPEPSPRRVRTRRLATLGSTVSATCTTAAE